MKTIKFYASAVLALFILTGCGGEEATTVIEDTPSIEELRAQKKQNVYVLKTIEGEEIKIEIVNNILTSKQLNGKVVLLNFFATWCPPCKKEIPMFNEVVEKYPNNFKIVSVLFQDKIELEKLKEFTKELKVNFDVTIGEANDRLAKAYNIRRVPESYVFNKEGVMIKEYIGIVDELELEMLIKAETNK